MRWAFIAGIWLAVLTVASTIRADVTPVQLSLFNPIQLFSEECDVYGLRLDILYGNNRNVNGFDAGMINRVTKNGAGLQMGLVNTAKRMTGIQFGLIGCSAQQLCGIQIAGLGTVNTCYYTPNEIRQDAAAGSSNHVITGVQIAGLINDNLSDLTGIQIAGIFNESFDVRGAQIQAGLLGGNRANQMTGVQIQAGLLGINDAYQMTGVQIALGISQNETYDMTGFQLALVFNKAEHMKGVQFGLANYCKKMTGVQIGLVNIIKESPLAFFPVVNAHF